MQLHRNLTAKLRAEHEQARHEPNMVLMFAKIAVSTFARLVTLVAVSVDVKLEVECQDHHVT